MLFEKSDLQKCVVLPHSQAHMKTVKVAGDHWQITVKVVGWSLATDRGDNDNGGWSLAEDRGDNESGGGGHWQETEETVTKW